MRAMPSLGALASADAFHEALNIAGCDDLQLLRHLRTMLVIRFAEEHIGDMITAGKIVCPCHLGIGQEAVAVGVSASLEKTDRVFGGHRSHSHFLALGGDLGSLMSEVLGKESGCSRGMGGSMHLYGGDVGFIGSVPIVAGTVPLAVGAALACSMDGRGAVAVAYFGDGAAEEGVIHESLNFASTFKLPILFVCENNFFSSHLHINLRQPFESISRFAEAHGIPAAVIDGNDVVAVQNTSTAMVMEARAGKGPGFIEAVTYRWRGHVGASEDTDVGVNRKVDLSAWKRRDPVRRLAEALMNIGLLDQPQFGALQRDVKEQVALAWKRSEAAPFPNESVLRDWVYAK